MTPKRNRTLNAGAGLLTALTLGVASLAGCAPFDPNPVPGAGAQVPSTGGPSAAPSTPGTPVVTPPSTAPAAGRTLNIVGKINGVEIANAAYTGVDLVTGKTFPLVSAGGLNRKLMAVVNVPPTAPKTFKVVIRDTVNNKSVSTIVDRGTDGTLKGINATGSTGANVEVDEATSVASNALEGLFTMAAGADASQAQGLLDNFFTQANTLAAEAEKMTPAEKAKIADAVDASGSLPAATMTDVTTNIPALKTVMTDVVGKALQSFAAANVGGSQADFTALAADLAILEELGFNVNLDGGQLEISGNGIEISIEEEEPTTPGEPTVEEPGPVVDPEPEPDPEDEGLINDPGDNFAPQVTLTYNASNRLVLRVEQEEGEQDVYEIVARIPRDTTGTEFNGDAISPLASGTGTGGIVDANVSSGTFSVVRDTDIGEIDVESDLPFSANLSDPDWTGRWMDGGTKVADVNIFEDDDFVTLVIKNELPDNASATQNGHDTTMTVASGVLSMNRALLEVLEDSNSGTVEVFLSARGNGTTAHYTKNIAVEEEDN